MGKVDKWLESDGLALIEGFARDGLIDEDISKKMGVARSTLAKWKTLYPAIATALSKGKEVVDMQVENALLKRAMGYKSEEIIYKNGTEFQRVVKDVPPDTTAQIFWLKNRRPDKWRDKPRQYDDTDTETGLIEIVPQIDIKGE